MAKNDNLQDFLRDVANAIRNKKGTSDLINPQNFSSEIESIESSSFNAELFYGFWIAEVVINNVVMGYNIYKIYDNDTMDVLEVTTDGTIQNDVKGITYTISGKVLTPNASAGTLTYQEDGTLYQLYNGQLPLTFTRKLFSDGALSVTENGTYKPLIHNGYATVDVNVQGGDYDIEVTDNNDGTQSLAIVDSNSSIDRNAIIRGLISGGLTEIVIPEGTFNIRNYAFYQQSSLKSVTIPDSVISINYSAFMYCRGLTGVTFGKNSKLITIESNAFDSCKSLTSIVIPNSVRTINDYAFRYCNGLTSITFDANTRLSIGGTAFYDCTGLTKVNYIGSIEGWCNITFKQVYSNPVYYAKNLHINNELITEIEIPSTITKINNYAFQYCTSLTSVTIGNGVTSIGNSAFSNCTSLTSITIPNSVTSIGNGAFYGCSKLTEMTILATTPPTLSNTNAISSATTKIYIPKGTLSTYQSATNWSSFASKFVELEV